jgi:anti-sigma B factor antagonist
VDENVHRSAESIRDQVDWTESKGVNGMSMEVKRRHLGDVAVIDASGRITVSEESNVISNELRSLTASGYRKILLNLADVSYIDSTGIGELVAAFTSVVKAGGTMKLLNPSNRVKDLLRMTNLNTIFDVHEYEANAVLSFV